MYSVAIKNEEKLYQPVLRPIDHLQPLLHLWKCATFHDQMCSCVHLLVWRIFWALLVNC